MTMHSIDLMWLLTQDSIRSGRNSLRTPSNFHKVNRSGIALNVTMKFELNLDCELGCDFERLKAIILWIDTPKPKGRRNSSVGKCHWDFWAFSWYTAARKGVDMPQVSKRLSIPRARSDASIRKHFEIEHPDKTPTEAYREKQREDPALRQRMKQRGEWAGLVKQQRQQEKLHTWGPDTGHDLSYLCFKDPPPEGFKRQQRSLMWLTCAQCRRLGNPHTFKTKSCEVAKHLSMLKLERLWGLLLMQVLQLSRCLLLKLKKS